jgi:IS5 family transposase
VIGDSKCLSSCYKIYSIKQAALPLSLSVKKNRKAEFLEQMERVASWVELVSLITP